MKILHIPTGQICWYVDWKSINSFGISFIPKYTSSSIEFKEEISIEEYARLCEYGEITLFGSDGNELYRFKGKADFTTNEIFGTLDEFELIP